MTRGDGVLIYGVRQVARTVDMVSFELRIVPDNFLNAVAQRLMIGNGAEDLNVARVCIEENTLDSQRNERSQGAGCCSKAFAVTVRGMTAPFPTALGKCVSRDTDCLTAQPTPFNMLMRIDVP